MITIVGTAENLTKEGMSLILGAESGGEVTLRVSSSLFHLAADLLDLSLQDLCETKEGITKVHEPREFNSKLYTFTIIR
jgi:hypothetical protein